MLQKKKTTKPFFKKLVILGERGGRKKEGKRKKGEGGRPFRRERTRGQERMLEKWRQSRKKRTQKTNQRKLQSLSLSFDRDIIQQFL